MSDLKISEAGTVQFPMVKHAAEIGWTPLTPEVAKQKRGGEAGVLLRDELEAKLSEFNPHLTATQINSVLSDIYGPSAARVALHPRHPRVTS